MTSMNKHLPLDFFELALPVWTEASWGAFLCWQVQSNSLQLQHSTKKLRAGSGEHPCPAAGFNLEECLSTAKVPKVFRNVIVSKHNIALHKSNCFFLISECCYCGKCRSEIHVYFQILLKFVIIRCVWWHFFFSFPLWGKKQPSRLYLVTKTLSSDKLK